jgi:hypothetical protein
MGTTYSYSLDNYRPLPDSPAMTMNQYSFVGALLPPVPEPPPDPEPEPEVTYGDILTATDEAERVLEAAGQQIRKLTRLIRDYKAVNGK